jgi:hypothetical protein
VSYTEILSRPEASLYYPSSQVTQSFASLEGSYQCGIGGFGCRNLETPASVNKVLVASGATPQLILDWYDHQLRGRGWRPGPNTGYELASAYLRNRGERFEVQAYRPTRNSRTGVDEVRSGTYDIRYQFARCAGVAAGCSSDLTPETSSEARPPLPLPKEPITHDDVISRAEARVFFPGSVLLTSGATADGISFGDTPASVNSSLIALGSTPQQVATWYETEMPRRGWTPDGTSNPYFIQYRRENREVFRLEVSDLVNGVNVPFGASGAFYKVAFYIEALEAIVTATSPDSKVSVRQGQATIPLSAPYTITVSQGMLVRLDLISNATGTPWSIWPRNTNPDILSPRYVNGAQNVIAIYRATSPGDASLETTLPCPIPGCSPTSLVVNIIVTE